MTSGYCHVLCYGTPCSMTNGYQRFAEGISLKKQTVCSYETQLRTCAHVRGTERKCRTVNIHCFENVWTKSITAEQKSSVSAVISVSFIRSNLIGNNFDVRGSTSPVGQGLIVEISRSYSDTSQSVGLFLAIDRPDAETSTWLHTTLTTQTDIHAADRIRTQNPSRRAVADPRLGPRGPWNQQARDAGQCAIYCLYFDTC